MIDEDKIIAAYIRTNYPEMLNTPAYLVFKATYALITPMVKMFIEAAQNFISVFKEDENE